MVGASPSPLTPVTRVPRSRAGPEGELPAGTTINDFNGLSTSGSLFVFLVFAFSNPMSNL